MKLLASPCTRGRLEKRGTRGSQRGVSEMVNENFGVNKDARAGREGR